VILFICGNFLSKNQEQPEDRQFSKSVNWHPVKIHFAPEIQPSRHRVKAIIVKILIAINPP